jgi:superfamily II DNA helicase RecQ
MGALVRHFGDEEDANRACGICDVCDPGGAVLRLFRRPTVTERATAQAIADELRAVDYKAAGTLQRNLDLAGRISRNEFDALLDSMVRAGLIMIEEAVFEKDGEAIRYRKVRLTAAGLELRPSTPVELLLSDGIVEEFGGRGPAPVRSKKAKAAPGKTAARSAATGGSAGSVGSKPAEADPVKLSAEDEALAARFRAWRMAEAKRLGVPPFLVLHDRAVIALAKARPANPAQLMAVVGIGPGKAEKFGEAILELCKGPE